MLEVRSQAKSTTRKTPANTTNFHPAQEGSVTGGTVGCIKGQHIDTVTQGKRAFLNLIRHT